MIASVEMIFNFVFVINNARRVFRIQNRKDEAPNEPHHTK